MEVKVAFEDAGYLENFTVHPYVKTFIAIAGDSTVLLGAKGGGLMTSRSGSPPRGIARPRATRSTCHSRRS